MSSPRDACEDKHAALAGWWLQNNRAFSIWFLTTLPDTEARREVLLTAAPNMPSKPPEARDAHMQGRLPTAQLLPELSQEGFLAGGGKLLVLFFARRCVRGRAEAACGMAQDLKLLNDLSLSGRLPRLDHGALGASLQEGIAFVDPVGDPSESIQVVSRTASVEVQQAIADRLSNGSLIEERVYLALRVRRDAIVTFLIALVEQFESATLPPPPAAASRIESQGSPPPTLVNTCGGQAHSALAAAQDQLQRSVEAVERALQGGLRFADAFEEQVARRRRIKNDLTSSLDEGTLGKKPAALLGSDKR